MRPLWKDVLDAVFLGMILPGILLNLFLWKEGHWEKSSEPASKGQIPEQSGLLISVRNPDGSVSSLDLDVYLTGVLLAEIPAGFHTEALKAQSVAARTYTWKACITGGKHGDGSVCTNPACCQGHIGEEVYLSAGGTEEHLEKVRHAVQTTSDMALYYEGELIEATYFSSSGGSTESALAVWGADYPYLQAVSSPEEGVVDTLIFTRDDFGQSLGIELTENDSQWLGPVSYTDGGGVETMVIGGHSYTGVQLRALLGLRSTAFQMETEGENILVTTRGYGHRVGLSQYGANKMAEQGSTWQQILQHYYPGTTLALVS